MCLGFSFQILSGAGARHAFSLTSTSKSASPGWYEYNLINWLQPLFVQFAQSAMRMARSAPPFPPLYVNKLKWMPTLPVNALLGINSCSLDTKQSSRATYHVWIRYLCLWASVIHPRRVIIFWIHSESHKLFWMRLWHHVSTCDSSCGPHRFNSEQIRGIKALTTVSPRWKWASCMLLIYSCPLDWIKNSHLRMIKILLLKSLKLDCSKLHYKKG